MTIKDPLRRKMRVRYCEVELTENKSAPYHIEFIGRYRPHFDATGRFHGTKITVAFHRCRYDDLKNVIDQWIDQAKLPNEP